jgi:hypothetical protein
MAKTAWHEVDAMTIRNSWHKAGILLDTQATRTVKLHPSIPISHLLTVPDQAQPSLALALPISSLLNVDPIMEVKNMVTTAMDQLVNIGVLQSSNCMDIKALLNPVDEYKGAGDVLDESIYQLVMAAKEACEKGGANGYNDNTDDDAITFSPCLAHSEVFKAISLLTTFTSDMDDPVAHKLDSAILAFQQQLHLDVAAGLQDTKITDFFTRSN